MNTLAKTLLGMTAALSLTLAAGTVGAGPWGGGGPGSGGPWGGGGPHGGDPAQRLEMMQQRQAARLDQLRQTLQLRPDQESTWQAFVAAHQAMPPGGHWKAMQQQASGTAPEHFEKRIQFMEERLTNLKTLAKAANNLYAVLDGSQQKAMDTFFNQWPRLGQRAQGN